MYNVFQNIIKIEKGDPKEFRQKEAEKFIDYVRYMRFIPDFNNSNYYGLSDMQHFSFLDEFENSEGIKIVLKMKKLIGYGFDSNSNIAIRYRSRNQQSFYNHIEERIFKINNFLNFKLFENFVEFSGNDTVILNLMNFNDLGTEFRETLLWFICYLIREMIRSNYQYEMFVFNTHDDKHNKIKQQDNASKSYSHGLDPIMLNRNGIDKNLLEFSIKFLNKIDHNDSIFKLYWDGMNLYLITNSQSDWCKPEGEEIEIQPNISLVIDKVTTFIEPSLSLINMNTIMKLEQEIDDYKERINNVIKDFDIDKLILQAYNSAILYPELFHRTKEKEPDLYCYRSLVDVNKYLDKLADIIYKLFPNRDKNDIVEKVFRISPLNIFDSSDDSVKHELVSEVTNYLKRLSLMNEIRTFSNYNNFANKFIKSQKSISKEIYLYKIKLIIFRYLANIVEGK